MDLYDVVRKLTGPIIPIGETSVDDRRFANLDDVAGLAGELLADIIEVARHRDRQEHSISKAGKFAQKFLMEVVDEIVPEEGGNQPRIKCTHGLDDSAECSRCQELLAWVGTLR